MVIREFGKDNDRTLAMFQPTAQPWQAFEPAARGLADFYHVFLVTPDGHDPEDPNRSDFVSVEKTVHDVLTWLRMRGIDSLDAAYGQSMGGGMVMYLIANDLMPVGRAIVDGGTAPYRFPAPICRLIAIRDYLGVKLLFGNRRLMEAVFPPKRWTPEGEDPVKLYDELMEFLNTFSNKTIRNVFFSANNWSAPAEPQNVTTPIQFWFGADEERGRARDLRWARAYFPQIEVRKIPNMDHGELLVCHPDDMVREARTFLDGQ